MPVSTIAAVIAALAATTVASPLYRPSAKNPGYRLVRRQDNTTVPTEPVAPTEPVTDGVDWCANADLLSPSG